MTDEIFGPAPERSKYTDAVVKDWLAFVKHTDTCKPCSVFAYGLRRTNKFLPEEAEQCCEEGTILILTWRGSCDELKQQSAFARKVARK